MALYFFGIFSIKKKKVKLDLKNYPKLKEVENEPCRIVCSNHVSFLDILIYFT